MLAFAAAFAAEKAGAGSIAQQFESSMTGVGLTFVLLTVASCISIKSVRSESIGPFQPPVMLTSIQVFNTLKKLDRFYKRKNRNEEDLLYKWMQAEMLNGRAAMVGFAVLLLAESGSSTFFN